MQVTAGNAYAVTMVTMSLPGLFHRTYFSQVQYPPVENMDGEDECENAVISVRDP